jgi:hypothetical protein
MNPEDSKQFDEIMGRNFSKNEESKISGEAMGEHIWNKVSAIFGGPTTPEEESAHRDAVLLSRARHFPESMIGKDSSGELEVQHREPDGWKHTWGGGAYIEHHHPVHGPIEVTNIHDYSAKWGEQPYEKGLFTPHEFLSHVTDFHDYKKEYE